MFYLAKIAQAAGLVTIGFGFMTAFPKLMNMRTLMMGVILFAFGWIVEKYLLKR